MNQNARVDRFISRMKNEVSQPKNEIYENANLVKRINSILTQKPVAPRLKNITIIKSFLVSGMVMNRQ